jgi:hypothetical protein
VFCQWVTAGLAKAHVRKYIRGEYGAVPLPVGQRFGILVPY